MKSQLDERDQQLVDLQKNSKNVDDLNEQIKQLQSDNKKANEEWQNKLATQTKNFKIETALREAKAKNVKATAQPPGKKAQRLSLLSGGERSLTAITLLFALLKFRPVPFAVLDEAEAALDDANVARYSQYLKNFDDETQFIVITHRKGTGLNLS